MTDRKVIYADEAMAAVRAEEELNGTPFQALGFWKGLRIFLFIIFHPFESQRHAVRFTKRGILDRIEDIA